MLDLSIHRPQRAVLPGEGARVGGASGVAQPLDAEKVGRLCCAAVMGSRVDFPADGSETRLLGTPECCDAWVSGWVKCWVEMVEAGEGHVCVRGVKVG